MADQVETQEEPVELPKRPPAKPRVSLAIAVGLIGCYLILPTAGLMFLIVCVAIIVPQYVPTLFGISLLLILYSWLPGWMFGWLAGMAIVLRPAYDHHLPMWYRRFEYYQSQVAVANTSTYLDQLGLRFTAYEVLDSYGRYLIRDREPDYYRGFRDNLVRLTKTLTGIIEQHPRDDRRGLDFPCPYPDRRNGALGDRA